MANRVGPGRGHGLLELSCILMLTSVASGSALAAENAAGVTKVEKGGSRIVPAKPEKYVDKRPGAPYRLEARDQGVVLKHGDGPGKCDVYGAREALVYEAGGTYYLHYDGAGLKGWLACLAVSKDLVHWTKKGPVLDFGKPGETTPRRPRRRGCITTANSGTCSMSARSGPRRRPI